jgi:hypothetical protein
VAESGDLAEARAAHPHIIVHGDFDPLPNGIEIASL